MTRSLRDINADLLALDAREERLFAEAGANRAGPGAREAHDQGLEAAEDYLASLPAGRREADARYFTGWRKIEDERAALRAEEQAMRDQVASAFMAGGRHIEAERPITPKGNTMTIDSHRSAVQSAALRTIDAAKDISPAAASRLEHIVRVEPMPAHARYLAAVGDPDYFSAWAAIVASPERAAIELNGEERAAVREARDAFASMNLALGGDPGGIIGTGYPLPLAVDPTLIITGDGSLNPFRNVATQRTIVAKQLQVVTAAQVTASYGAEGSDAAEVSPDPAGVTLTAQRGTAFVRLTYELVADLAGAASEVARLFADAKDNLEATKFALGTGTNEPQGIVTGIELDAGPFDDPPATVADFVAVQEDLGPRYQARARWLMTIAGLNGASQLVAEADDTNAKIMDAAGNLLRKPVTEVPTLGSGRTIYGDIGAGFAIVDRLGMSVEPTGVTFNKTTGVPDGSRGFLAIWRSGSGLVDGNAVRLLEVEPS